VARSNVCAANPSAGSRTDTAMLDAVAAAARRRRDLVGV